MQGNHRDSTNNKHALRQTIRKQLASVSTDTWQQASLETCQFFSAAHKLINAPSPVAIFAAQATEINLAHLHRLHPGIPLLYPLCQPDNSLTFHQVEHPGQLTPGKHDILEPNPEHHPEVDLNDIRLFLCPGLAFAKDGTRLGQGGGYYDRTFAKKSADAQIWGVCLESQILPALPSQSHDQPVQGMLTETGFIAATPG